MTAALGRLVKVPLRDAWASEATDFSPWLARDENLRLLGDAIGLDLELESQEEPVGAFRADILARDTATDSWVIIENQIEKTDHTHLGQLLVYAAGLEAVTIVWIAAQFSQEHRAATDWLNRHTDETVNLFGLEVELWKIGDSPVAPKFNIVSRPNDWSRTLKVSAGSSGNLSNHKQTQMRFWESYREYMESSGSIVRCQKPKARHWMSHAIGRAGIHLNSVVSISSSDITSHSPEIRVELVLETANAKRDFAELQARKDEIEMALGFPLTWHNPEDTATCKLYSRLDADWPNNSQTWPDQFEWMRLRLEIMNKVLGPIVKALGSSEE